MRFKRANVNVVNHKGEILLYFLLNVNVTNIPFHRAFFLLSFLEVNNPVCHKALFACKVKKMLLRMKSAIIHKIFCKLKKNKSEFLLDKIYKNLTLKRGHAPTNQNQKSLILPKKQQTIINM